MKDLEYLVGLGPRVAGSPESTRQLEYLKQELGRAGLRTFDQTFEADTPLGKRTMTNLVAVVEGTQPGVLLFGNHHDTKYLPKFTFVGANDGGSTTAWMLEMARALGPKRDGRTIWLVWFDGEEAFKRYSDSDGFYGSRAFVKHLQKTGELPSIHAMINVDMIGDIYLGLQRDAHAAPWLQDIVWDTARRLGYGRHFGLSSRDIQDDDQAFLKAGVPTLLLIDFNYGGSVLDHQRNWHTAQDTLDKVCGESLQAIADVIYHALPDMETYLDHPKPQNGNG